MEDKIRHRIERLVEAMNARPQPIQSITADFIFNMKEGNSYFVSFNVGQVCLVDEGEAACTITLSEKDMLKLLDNNLNATMAYMTGAIKVDGKLTLAMKLLEVLKAY